MNGNLHFGKKRMLPTLVLPCLTFAIAATVAVDAAAISFKDVRPVAVATNETAAADAALRDLLRRRDEAERAGDWDAAIKASMEALGYPMSPGALHNARMRLVRDVGEGARRYEDAASLAIEIFDDETVAPDDRASAAASAASTLCQKIGRQAEATEILARADALETTQRKRRDMRGMRIVHFTHHVKPVDWKMVQDLHLSIATNGFFAMADRVGNACGYIGAFRNLKTAEEKRAFLPAVEKFLADNAGELSARDVARVRFDSFKLLFDAGFGEESSAIAAEIAANTNAVPGHRVQCAAHLADARLAERDFGAAVAILEGCYDYPGLNANDYVAIAQRIGDVYICQDNLDAACLAYRAAVPRCDTPEVRRRVADLVAEAYKSFYRYSEARDTYLAAGNKLAAARQASR